MGAAEVERYRVQQELLTAAQRAGRAVTPELTREITEYAERAGEAAKRNEEIRERMRDLDGVRSVGSDGVRSLVRDLGVAARPRRGRPHDPLPVRPVRPIGHAHGYAAG